MKRRLMFSAAMLLVLAAVQAGAQRRSREQSEREIRQIEQDAVEATMAHNWRFFDRILTPEWTAIDSQGRQIDKAEMMSELKRASPRLDKVQISMRLYDVNIRFLSDDVVLLTTRLVTSSSGRTFTVRGTEVYVWRDGRWVVTATQTTPIKGT
jgi:hypothetical protein